MLTDSWPQIGSRKSLKSSLKEYSILVTIVVSIITYSNCIAVQQPINLEKKEENIGWLLGKLTQASSKANKSEAKLLGQQIINKLGVRGGVVQGKKLVSQLLAAGVFTSTEAEVEIIKLQFCEALNGSHLSKAENLSDQLANLLRRDKLLIQNQSVKELAWVIEFLGFWQVGVKIKPDSIKQVWYNLVEENYQVDSNYINELNQLKEKFGYGENLLQLALNKEENEEIKELLNKYGSEPDREIFYNIKKYHLHLLLASQIINKHGFNEQAQAQIGKAIQEAKRMNSEYRINKTVQIILNGYNDNTLNGEDGEFKNMVDSLVLLSIDNDTLIQNMVSKITSKANQIKEEQIRSEESQINNIIKRQSIAIKIMIAVFILLVIIAVWVQFRKTKSN
jgi:hypothetical protein